MKELVISLKSSSGVMKNFRKYFKKIRSRKMKNSHHEISFDNRKDFERFARNIFILSSILTLKPKSIYELAHMSGTDVSNLNKIIIFFEDLGVIKVKRRKVNGRQVNTPLVPYDAIKIDLKAA